jgi:hypothetical protein
MRVLLSVLLLAPPAFCMGMMFPLGLGIWRRHSGLLPFFWSANGITSMLASVLGMALSIEFGISKTYALGVGCYAVCALMVAASRRANPIVSFAASPAAQPGSPRPNRAASASDAVAPSIQPAQVEMVAGLPPLARADELAGPG